MYLYLKGDWYLCIFKAQSAICKLLIQIVYASEKDYHRVLWHIQQNNGLVSFITLLSLNRPFVVLRYYHAKKLTYPNTQSFSSFAHMKLNAS